MLPGMSATTRYYVGKAARLSSGVIAHSHLLSCSPKILYSLLSQRKFIGSLKNNTAGPGQVT